MPLIRAKVGLEPLPGGGIEQMDAGRVRRERDGLAGPRVGAAMRGNDERSVRHLHHQLGFRAHRLNHHHFGGDGALAADRDVFGSQAVLHRLAFRAARQRADY